MMDVIQRGNKGMADAGIAIKVVSAQAFAYLTEGKIGYRPVLDVIRRTKIIHVTILDTDAPPAQVRLAAIWTIGMLVTPDDPLVPRNS